MNHCDTCVCDYPNSLDALSNRVKRLITGGDIPAPDVSGKVRSILSDSPMYHFGFREFIPTPYDNSVVGALFCGLTKNTSDPRYFVCVIPPPNFGLKIGEPKVQEYRRGDPFDITNGQIWREDIERIMGLNDVEICSWIYKSLEALADYVEVAIRTPRKL